MPALTPKRLEDYADEIRLPWVEALANPKKKVLAAEGVSVKRANYIHARLKSARRGMRTFYPREHEYFRASEGNRMHVRDEKFPGNPDLRNVWCWFDGLILRPSEIFDQYMKEYLAGRRSTPF